MAQTDFDKDEKETIYQDFKEAVNMTPSELEKWLKTDESKEVGYRHEGEKESVGHDSGRKIVKILHTNKSDLTDADYAHMRKVVGYVHRHMAQRPSGNIDETPWRYSLKNWGHEPKN